MSSAIRWCAWLRETGSVLPRAPGGNRRSGRIEAHAALILEVVARTPDLTLAELRAVLAASGLAIVTLLPMCGTSDGKQATNTQGWHIGRIQVVVAAPRFLGREAPQTIAKL